MIIHISGFPGSGKTTLGNKIQKMLGKKVVVYDTDLFIQHHNDNGKK
jgi:uridine kinase